MGPGEEHLEILRMELRKNETKLKKERSAGGEEKLETNHLWTLQPWMFGCVKQAEMQASFLCSVGKSGTQSFMFSICSLFVF